MPPTRNISTRGSISVHIALPCLSSPSPSIPAGTTHHILTQLPWGKYWVLPLRILLHRGVPRRSPVPREPTFCCTVAALRETRSLVQFDKEMPAWAGVVGSVAAAESCSPSEPMRCGFLRFRGAHRIAQRSHRWSLFRTWNESTPPLDQLGRLWSRNCVGSGLGIASVDRGRRWV